MSDPVTLELTIDRPVAGGRMLARHDGRIVLVSGAIPGERVRATVERTARNTIWAQTVEVIEASASRRAGTLEPDCGGQVYAHVRYEDQCRLKAEVVADAFRRIGKMPLDGPPVVQPSAEHGYRVRARLRVRQRRAGFFREGTHTLCDAGRTRQLVPDALAAVEVLVGRLGESAHQCESVVVAENVAATERVLHIEPREGVDGARLAAGNVGVDVAVPIEGATGVTLAGRGGARTLWGRGHVTDLARDLFHGESPVPEETRWSRGATSFFQGNRYLTGALVREVLSVAVGDRLADLYAGVGLFAVALAARGTRVTAVEGDTVSGRDLRTNAMPYGDALLVRLVTTEAMGTLPGRYDAVIVDPPRTGLSTRALAVVASLAAPRVVYVSCDPATLARDAAILASKGYQLRSLCGFDLFPNTAHVECVASFDLASGRV
jgi:23S rRNA (uracil1939-C5)-methyltransferase